MYMGPSAPQAKSRHSVPQSLSRLVLVTSVRGEDFAEQAGDGIQIEYSCNLLICSVLVRWY